MAYTISLFKLSAIRQSQSNYDAAESLLLQALDELKEPLQPECHQIKEACQHLLAKILAHHHRKFGVAEQMLRQNLANPHGPARESRLFVEYSLARNLMMQHRNSEAVTILRQLLNGNEQLSERTRITFTWDLGRALQRQGKLIEAEAIFRQASEDVLVHGPADLRSQTFLLALGELKSAQKAYGEAASTLRQACEAIAAPYHQIHLECQLSLGHALEHLKCYDESLACYTRALDGSVRMYGVDHRRTRRCSREVEEARAILRRKTETEK